MNRFLSLPLAILLILAAGHAEAGMPSVLPEDFAQLLRLDDSARFRLQSISFFAFLFVLATIAFRMLWNNLAYSFSTLPRLSLLRAACLTLLLGSMFIVVLTMISGARELLTPGAWRKAGLTYTVAPPGADASSDSDAGSPDANAAGVLP